MDDRRFQNFAQRDVSFRSYVNDDLVAASCGRLRDRFMLGQPPGRYYNRRR
jgi:hypothetical protein